MFTQHPLSAAFPAMSETELQALVLDITQNGQREHGVIYGGQIIDGWHRYQACQCAGVEFQFTELELSQDPVTFVKSRNLHRRHLTDSQRAAAVVACVEWATVGKPANREPGSLLQTREQMANDADVSIKTIQQAKTAHAAGLGEAVRDGAISAKRAAQLSKQAPELVKQVTNGEISLSDAVAQINPAKDQKTQPQATEPNDDDLEGLVTAESIIDDLNETVKQLTERNDELEQLHKSLTVMDSGAEIARLSKLYFNAQHQSDLKSNQIYSQEKRLKEYGNWFNALREICQTEDNRAVVAIVRRRFANGVAV